MKKQVLTQILALFAMVAFAEKVEVNGLYYELINKNLTAIVAPSDGEKYSGDIVIPETIEYGGSSYSVTRIGSNAFKGCDNLLSVSISNNVINIDYSAFEGCVNLVTVLLSDNIGVIEGNAFYNCNALSNIILPKSLKTIGNGAFFNCCSLTSLQIPDSVVSIGSTAFMGCGGLTTISIGKSVEAINGYAFEGCINLESVHITDLSAWCNIDFSKTGHVYWQETPTNPLYHAHHLFLNGEEIVDLVIPDDVNIITGAFDGCTGLKTVTFNNKVVIRNNAFRNCTGLEKVFAPDIETWLGFVFGSYCANPLDYAHCLYLNNEEINELNIPTIITSIGNSAFIGSNTLTKISMPNTVTSIGEDAFNNCSSLKDVILPGSLEDIGARAFYGCLEIADVYCYADKIPSTGDQVFRNALTEYATLHVPENSINDYSSKAPWNGFGKIVALKDDDPQPTGILSIANNKKGTIWFDMNGRKLSSEPSSKGIYINNGKKVIK